MSPLEMISQVLQWPKEWICQGLGGVGAGCANCGSGVPQGAAESVYYFGLYAITLGIVNFAVARTPVGRWFRKVIGLPEEPEPWLDLFCSTLVLVGLLYVIAAVANLGPVFWAMVLGRIAIGFTCVWFVLHDHFANQDSKRSGRFTPYGIGAAVIFIALPDVVSAIITAGHLLNAPLPAPLASASPVLAGNSAPLWVFTMGVSDVVAGLLILAFPRVIQDSALFHEPDDSKVGSPAEMHPDPRLRRWAAVFAVLMTAIGGYEILAAVNGYLPYFWATIVVNALFFVASLLICIFRRLPSGARSWPLLIYGAVQLLLAVFAFIGIRDLPRALP